MPMFVIALAVPGVISALAMLRDGDAVPPPGLRLIKVGAALDEVALRSALPGGLELVGGAKRSLAVYAAHDPHFAGAALLVTAGAMLAAGAGCHAPARGRSVPSAGMGTLEEVR